MNIMRNMTNEEKTAYRQKKLKEIQDYNRDFINDMQIKDADFNMKSRFTHNGVYVVSVFDNEFKHKNGYYIEIIDSDLNPADPNRTIYKIPYNEHYEEEYEADDRENKFIVPLDDLQIINRQSVAIKKSAAVTSSDRVLNEKVTPIKPEANFFSKLEDAPCSQMTIRDYVAIKTGKPVSQKSWLNDLLKTIK